VEIIEPKIRAYFDNLSLYEFFLALFFYRSRATYFILIGILLGGAYQLADSYELRTAKLKYHDSEQVKKYLNEKAENTLKAAEDTLLLIDSKDPDVQNFQKLIQLFQGKNNTVAWNAFQDGGEFVLTQRCSLLGLICDSSSQDLALQANQLKLLIFNEVILRERSIYLGGARDVLSNYVQKSSKLQIELNDQMNRYRKALKYITSDKKNADSRLLDTYLANYFQLEHEIEQLELMKKNSEDFTQRINSIHPIFISRPDLFDVLYSINGAGGSANQLTLGFQKTMEEIQRNLYTDAFISVNPNTVKVFGFKYLWLGFLFGFLGFVFYALYNSLLNHINQQKSFIDEPA
jgi:hypothetical protein